MRIQAAHLALGIALLVLALCHRSVTADEEADSTCKTANDNLDAMYRCRSSEFQVKPFCMNASPHELKCNRSRKIAVVSASIRPSQGNTCDQPERSVSRRSSSRRDLQSDDAGEEECCVLQHVEARCHRKQKCHLNHRELLLSVGGRCPSTRTGDRHQQPLELVVVYICVSQRMFRDIVRDSSSPDSFCEGQLEAYGSDEDEDGAGREERVQPVGIARFDPHSTVSLPTATGSVVRSKPADADEMLSSEGGDDGTSPEHTSVPVAGVSNARGGSIDWLWSLFFVKENMDRFLIYLFLSIAVGVIIVLLLVIIGLCFGRRYRKRKSASKDVTDPVKSTAHTTDDNTSSLIASSHTPGIEMVHYAPADTLRTGGRPSSTYANAVRFAPSSDEDNRTGRTHGSSTFTGNGTSGHRGLDFPAYQLDSSRDSVDSDGRGTRMGDSDDHRSSTLGRFYSNPYRHDSYRADGYRTLQHK